MISGIKEVLRYDDKTGNFYYLKDGNNQQTGNQFPKPMEC